MMTIFFTFWRTNNVLLPRNATNWLHYIFSMLNWRLQRWWWRWRHLLYLNTNWHSIHLIQIAANVPNQSPSNSICKFNSYYWRYISDWWEFGGKIVSLWGTNMYVSTIISWWGTNLYVSTIIFWWGTNLFVCTI